MPANTSPADRLWSGWARAGDVMQQGLDRLAADQDRMRALNPLVWAQLAVKAMSAAVDSVPVHEEHAQVRSITHQETRADLPSTPAPPGSEWFKNGLRPPVPLSVPPAAPVRAPGPGADELQSLIDTDAVFSFFSLPARGSEMKVVAHGKGTCRYSTKLHRFIVKLSAPTNQAPLAGRFTLGEPLGSCHWTWLGIDGKEVMSATGPAARVAAFEGIFEFGDGKNAFRGSGIGRFVPVTTRGRRHTHLTAIGIPEPGSGSGRFRKNESGFFVCAGTLTHDGFRGLIMLRLNDQQSELQTTDPLSAPVHVQSPEHGVTWLTVRAQALADIPPAPLSPDELQRGIVLRQDLRLMDVDAAQGSGALQSTRGIRQLIGAVTSRIAWETHKSSSASLEPQPFAVWREFSFVDFLGNPVGSFIAEAHGIALFTELKGVRAVRYASVGQVVRGTGRFAGISATIVENSLTTLSPYAGSSIYSLRVEDPEGRFYGRSGIWRDIPVEEVAQKK